MRTALLSLVLLIPLACAPGKPSTQSRPRSGGPPGRIREINLLAMPSALNLDDREGADGVIVKIYAIPTNDPRATSIKEGTLEILAFDGTLENGEPTKLIHAWAFTSDQLKPHETRTMLGTGYDLLLDWTPDRLTGTRVTIIAKYLAPDGLTVISTPSYVPVTTL